MFPTPEIDDIRLFPSVPLWKKILFGLVLLFLVAYLAWCFLWPKAKPQVNFVAAHTTAAVADLPPVAVTMKSKTVQALPKAAAVKRLHLQPEIAGDDDDQILQAVDIPPTEGGAVAVTFLNISTGQSRTVWREKPRPLLSFERGTEIGVRYGLNTKGNQVASLFARRDIVRISAAYLAGYGEVTARIGADPQPEAKAMIELSGRWK